MKQGAVILVAVLAVSAMGGATASGVTLAEILQGAKKEGRVSVLHHPSLAGKGIDRVKRGVASKYGVDLQIDYTPAAAYPQHLAKAITEHKAGARPSFDLMVLADATLARAVSAGIAEKEDWRPLLAEGTPGQVIQFDGHALSTHTNHIGLIFNPRVVPPQQAPKLLKDLADPRWRGKFILFPYTSLYLGYAMVLGMDQTLAALREIMKNEPAVEIYSRALTRYLAGEYPMVLIASGFLTDARKGGATQWASLDISFWTTHSVIVARGARSPNAAKLVALYLASPDGHRLMLEEAGSGSVFYPGNIEHEINQEDLRRGLKNYNPVLWPGSLDLILSEKGAQTEQEIGRILRGR